MSRRSGYNPNAIALKALTQSQYTNAKQMLNKMERETIATLVSVPFTAMDVVNWLWPEDVVAACRAAYGLIHQPSHNAYYPGVSIGGISCGFYVSQRNLRLDEIVLPIVLPDGSAMRKVHNAVTLEGTLRQMYDIHIKFNMAREVLDFLVVQSPGAMRAVWPSILALVPNERSPLHEAEGVRHKTIEGLGEYLPRIRDSAGLIASAILMPKRDGVPSSAWSVEFTGSQSFQIV